MKKVLSLEFYLSFLLIFSAVGQAAANTKAARSVTVPGDFPTIQAAVNVSSSVIVSPGVYNENIVIPDTGGVVTIKARNPGTVVINGGSLGSTIRVGTYGQVDLQGLVITNDQDLDYNSAAVYGYGLVRVSVSDCTIISRGSGVTTTYGVSTTVQRTSFTGTGPNSIGVMVNLSFALDTYQGARILNNSFQDEWVGIYHYDIYDYITLTRSTNRRSTDSNRYSNVLTPYFLTDTIILP